LSLLPNQNSNIDKFENANSLFKSKPILLYSGFINEDVSWYCPEHSHSFCEIIYICNGSGQFMIDGNLYVGGKGDIVIYNASVMHEEYSNPSNPLEMYYCAIDNIVIDGLAEQHIIPEIIAPIIKAGTLTSKLENYFNAIIMESSNKFSDYEIMCSNLLSCIIISILRYTNIPKSDIKVEVNPNSGESTKIYIDKNYSQDINLSNLSKAFYMSKDYLSHIFKNEIGFSPIKYLMMRRIEEAKKLLVSSELSINEISLTVGYEDANYFSAIFKKITGFSPINYRKNGKI